jgi:hypothetical protein
MRYSGFSLKSTGSSGQWNKKHVPQSLRRIILQEVLRRTYDAYFLSHAARNMARLADTIN